MKKIRGDVDVLGIANLLQALAMSRCEGYLAITQGDRKKIIQLGHSGMRLLSAGAARTPPLGAILLRTGKINRDQLNLFLNEQRKTGKRLGEIVAHSGILSREDIENALREQIYEEIYELFTWPEAVFEFTQAAGAAPPPPEGPLSELTLDSNVTSIMIEAVRRRDELARIQTVIGDLNMVPVRQDPPPSLDDPNMDRDAIENILPLIDGKRTVNQIIENSLHPKFTVLRTMYGLAQRGAVKLRDTKGFTTVHWPLPPMPRPPQRRRNVLILSDLPGFRSALAYCLRNAGFEILEGQASTDFTEILQRHHPDAIVLDISVDTDDALKIYAVIREWSKAPFIVLSGNPSRQAVIGAIQSGAHHVLLKPVKINQLIERISASLKG